MALSTVDPYKILGLAKDASIDDVQRAYRQKAAKYHPDAGGDAWVFQQVQEAYESIKNAKGNIPEAHNATPPDQPTRSSETQANSTSKTAPSNSARRATVETSSSPNSSQWLRHLLTGELPLQNEVTLFILVGVLDIFMTYMLLRLGAVEANPIARFFLVRWGFNGLIAFKMTSIALVTVLAQIIAQFKMSTAKKLLGYGTLVVGIVVVYSVFLLAGRL